MNFRQPVTPAAASKCLMKKQAKKMVLAAVAGMTVGYGAMWPLHSEAQQPACCRAQQATDPEALRLLRAAVETELNAAKNDHSSWMYLDADRTPGKNGVYRVVETPQGTVRRMVEIDGRPVDAQEERKETDRIRTFLHDTDAQAKQRRAGAHDDAQAEQMLRMLPDAFLWTRKGESGDLVTLEFTPNPAFDPPNMEARVMGLMAGEMIIARGDNRIRTLRGKLTDDVKIGYGMLGRLRRGGSFDVERREVAPHRWEITETHVHIDGRALLFKTIGQQEDEIKTEWKPSTASSLTEAAKLLSVD